jgi:hypothetical protein
MGEVQYYLVAFVVCDYQYDAIAEWRVAIAIRGEPNLFRLRQTLRNLAGPRMSARARTLHIYVSELTVVSAALFWGRYQRTVRPGACRPLGDALLVRTPDGVHAV